ncbi:MAG: hypothetical protein H8E27_06125 [Verrucomicrobia subdivision 3 bacterium]|nr:hypothetical protein [Limisphaerales bacterium]
MQKDLIIFYLKRHMLILVGLLLALGFVGYGYKFMTDAAAGRVEQDKAFEKVKSRREKISNPGNNIKIDEANIGKIQDEVNALDKLIVESGTVIRAGVEHQAMAGNDFTTHMVSVIKQLNRAAEEQQVNLPRDPSSKSDVQFPYYFTFFEVITKEHGVSEDKVPELQVQLEDVETIVNILLGSRVQSIELIQRNRVTKEDVGATRPNDYLKERKKYANSVAVVRPYRIKFHCLSGGIAKSLSGFASEELFYVVRKFEVKQAGANSASSGGMGMGGGEGGLGGGFGGEPGGGGGEGFGAGAAPGGGAGGGGAQAASGTPSVPLTLIEQGILEISAGLATPKAKNIMREQLLEVTIDLDVIRRLRPEEPEGEVGVGGNINPPGTAQAPNLSAIEGTNNAAPASGTNNPVTIPEATTVTPQPKQ